MPSPFPGFDPYLERPSQFPIFHGQFIGALQTAILAVLPPRYDARTDSEVVLREPPAAMRDVRRPPEDRKRPDVDVVLIGAKSQRGATAAATLQAPAQGEVAAGVTEEKHRWIEIVTPGGEKVVTHLEVLSPSNKQQDRTAYITKRARLLRSDTNLVEIDLLRGGRRMPVDGLPACDHVVLVARVGERGDGVTKPDRVGLWPIGLRERLPTIPIPLLTEDGDVALDLQAAFDRTYDEAGFGRAARGLYEQPVEPPLEGEDRAWAEALVAGRGTVDRGQ